MWTAFTGHRPGKLNGYNPNDNKELLWRLHDQIVKHIEAGTDTFVSGMALGIDQWAARIVLRLKKRFPHIKLVAAVPCADHQMKWGKESQEEWQYIIDRADKVYYVSEEPYTAHCMQDRNEWMTNHSNNIIAVWDGTPGGTSNCVASAKKSLRPITQLNPNEKG